MTDFNPRFSPDTEQLEQARREREDAARELFGRYDLDGDLLLSEDELGRLLLDYDFPVSEWTLHHEHGGHAKGWGRVEGGSAVVGGLPANLIFSQVDANGDKMVSFEEFTVFYNFFAEEYFTT